jgi:hypothetical protein
LQSPHICDIIVCFLSAQDLSNVAIGGTSVLRESCTSSSGEELWRLRLLDDFGVRRDKFISRSAGYYRRLYYSVLEETIMEENMIAGGH